IGESLYACTLPGSTSVVVTAVRSGRTTATVGTRMRSVSRRTSSRPPRRARMPSTNAMTTTIAPTATAMPPRRWGRGGGSAGMRPGWCKHGEHRRNEQQRRYGREHQPADHRAAERRVLLAAFAEPERHRQHADDHRERGHDHRPEPRVTGLDRGLA